MGCITNKLNGMVHADKVNDAEDDGDDRYDYRYMVNRDKRRWAKADQNGDGLLTKAEFSDFLHPEEVDHMKDVVIDVSNLCQQLTLYSHYNRNLDF